jgi:hypothetical protein
MHGPIGNQYRSDHYASVRGDLAMRNDGNIEPLFTDPSSPASPSILTPTEAIEAFTAHLSGEIPVKDDGLSLMRYADKDPEPLEDEDEDDDEEDEDDDDDDDDEWDDDDDDDEWDDDDDDEWDDDDDDDEEEDDEDEEE